MENYLNVANGIWIWIACIPVVLIVALQAVIFVKKARQAAPLVGMTSEEVNRAFRLGLTSAIGPALGVFVVMLGLMSAIGGPIAWQRLSIIGAAPTELTAATMAAQAQGLELGGQGYGLINFANASWVMALNGSAWLLTTGLFTDKLAIATKKISGGDTRKLAIIGGAAMCGAFGYLFGNELAKIVNPDPQVKTYAVAGICAVVAMFVLDRIAQKHPKLKEHTLGLAMLLGMFGAVVFKRIMNI